MFDLGVDPELLPGQSKTQKSRELVVFMERRGKLDQLVDAIERLQPVLGLSQLTAPDSDSSRYPVSAPVTGQLSSSLEGISLDATAVVTQNTPPIPVYQKDIDGLKNEIAGLRQQTIELIAKIGSGDSESKAVDELANEIIRAANRAVGRTEDLTAVLVPPKNPRIRLLMEHDVDRLEEYRSDENIAFLLTGLFAGAAVSIFVNWATDSTFSPTPISITLLILFGLLALGAYYWGYRLKKRAETIHKRQPQAPNTIS